VVSSVCGDLKKKLFPVTQILVLRHFIAREITAARIDKQVIILKLRPKAFSFYIHDGLLSPFCSEAKTTCCGTTASTAPSITRGPVPTSDNLEKQTLEKNMA